MYISTRATYSLSLACTFPLKTMPVPSNVTSPTFATCLLTPIRSTGYNPSKAFSNLTGTGCWQEIKTLSPSIFPPFRSVSDDIAFIVSEALKTIPEESRYYQCMNDVIRWHKEFPDDWKRTWFECEKKWSEDIGCPDGVFVPFFMICPILSDISEAVFGIPGDIKPA